MAVQMTQNSQINVAVFSEKSLMAGMPDDCPMLVQQTSEAQKSPGSTKSKAGCQSCQLCMSVASISVPHLYLLTCEGQCLAMASSTRFTNADLSRKVKPPIL
jgi:hypothetical protein